MAETYVGAMANGDSIYRKDDGSYVYGNDTTGWKDSPGHPDPYSAPKSAVPAPGNAAMPGTVSPPGTISQDYQGSYDEWYESTVEGMIDNYIDGVNQTSGYLDPSLGAPNETDFGSAKDGKDGVVSNATRRFFENYVRMYGATDPWIREHFGAAPDRRASYITDPNSEAGLQGGQFGENEKQRDWEGEQAEADRAVTREGYATDITLAGMQQQTAREGFQNQWNIATMEDATRRFIAEGDWGVQKYVTELQESGMMNRLVLELGFRREELGQRATEARQQHHESMVALTLEVAKFDAELAAQPRNWLKYAAWLQNRGQVVDGLNLSTAAALVPEQSIDPGEVAQDVNNAGGAFGLAQEAATGQYSVSGIDLNSEDYSGMANQLLGINSMNPEGAPTPGELQAVSNTLQTTPGAQQAQPAAAPAAMAQSVQQPSAAFAAPLDQASSRVGFRAYGGPTTNALGMTIQPSGQKEIYGRFKRLLSSQKQMRMGEVESIGRYAPDFEEEMERSKPKGRAAGVAAYG